MVKTLDALYLCHVHAQVSAGKAVHAKLLVDLESLFRELNGSLRAAVHTGYKVLERMERRFPSQQRRSPKSKLARGVKPEIVNAGSKEWRRAEQKRGAGGLYIPDRPGCQLFCRASL